MDRFEVGKKYHKLVGKVNKLSFCIDRYIKITGRTKMYLKVELTDLHRGIRNLSFEVKVTQFNPDQQEVVFFDESDTKYEFFSEFGIEEEPKQ